MITRVQVKNYRSLKEVDVTLGPLNVLVGKNGAGKSAFIDVLAFVNDSTKYGLDAAIGNRRGIRSIHHAPSWDTDDIEITLGLSLTTFSGNYGFTIVSTPSGDYSVKREMVTRPDVILFEANSGNWTSPTVSSKHGSASDILLPALAAAHDLGLQPVLDAARNLNVYSLTPERIREPQAPNPMLPLSRYADNLATFLHGLGNDHEIMVEIRSALQRISTRVANIRVTWLTSYSLVIEVEHKERVGTSWYELAQESDGTIRALAILAALYQPPSKEGVKDLIVIDEPELHLHPGALAVLADAVRDASTRRQVIITTQSPDLISHFTADELRVVENIDGETRIGPIEERQREAINAELFSGGDLLRIEGLHVAEATNA